MSDNCSSAAVHCFRPKGSYLDACRKQGVYQQHEEDRTSQAVLLDKILTSKNDLAGRILHLSTEPTLLAQRQQITDRFRTICDAYQSSGFGDPQFQFLMELLFNEDFHENDVSGLFEKLPTYEGRP
jgi:hypothetical protein